MLLDSTSSILPVPSPFWCYRSKSYSLPAPPPQSSPPSSPVVFCASLSPHLLPCDSSGGGAQQVMSWRAGPVGSLICNHLLIPPPCFAVLDLAWNSVTLLKCLGYLLQLESLAVTPGLTSRVPAWHRGPSDAGFHPPPHCAMF